LLLRLAGLAPLLVALALLAAAGGPSRADEPCCGPISANARRLNQMLDASGVDHLWIAGRHIDWMTGEPDQGLPGHREQATHCSAFAAAIAERLGVYVLRPPRHPQELLASAQARWLETSGASEGWRALPDVVAAQKAANQGDLVLEAYQSRDPRKPGHVAILRASEKSLAALDAEGPDEAQAGSTNSMRTTTIEGFRNHRGAWRSGGTGEMRYYAHAVDWQAAR
jgi:hypothetical protein